MKLELYLSTPISSCGFCFHISLYLYRSFVDNFKRKNIEVTLLLQLGARKSLPSR
jgi:hypothetical protein